MQDKTTKFEVVKLDEFTCTYVEFEKPANKIAICREGDRLIIFPIIETKGDK